jgi:NAD(P)-dependent dehydrogenase (short-subunit alcohol dehydrogenase family)
VAAVKATLSYCTLLDNYSRTSVFTTQNQEYFVDIKGAVALITGAASGLGNATAQTLHEQGARVVLVDLPTSAGQAIAEKIGAGAHFAAADVTSAEQVAAAADFAASLGDLRIVVNCAGVATPGKVLGRAGVLSLADFERVVRINLVGTFNMLRLAAEKMAATEPVDGERGVIINTASVAAFDGQIGQPAYAASKGAIAAMTLPVARELAGHLIRVVAIAPGIFETPMLAGLPEEAQQSLGRQVPHPSRLGRPSEYAALAAHIIANPMLNGETIRLDGAIRMAPK